MPEELQPKSGKVSSKGVKIFFIIIFIALILFLVFNYFYNINTGEPINIGTMFYPGYLRNIVAEIPKIIPEAPKPPPPTPEVKPPEPIIKPKIGIISRKSIIWLALIILLIITLTGTGLYLKKHIKEPPRIRIPERRKYENLKDIIKGKIDIFHRIRDIELKKPKILKDIKKIKEELSSLDPDEEVPKLMDKTSPEYNQSLKEKKKLRKLIKYEEAIEDLLKQLLEIEVRVHNMIPSLRKRASPQFIELLNQLQTITETIRPHLESYFKKQIKEIREEEHLEELLGKRHIEDRVKSNWNTLVQKDHDEIIRHFELETNHFNAIRDLIQTENEKIKQLVKLLKTQSLKSIGKELEEGLNNIKELYSAFENVFTQGLQNQKNLDKWLKYILDLTKKLKEIDEQIKAYEKPKFELAETQQEQAPQETLDKFTSTKVTYLQKILEALSRIKVFLDNENKIDQWVETYQKLMDKADPERWIRMDKDIIKDKEYLESIPGLDIDGTVNKIIQLSNETSLGLNKIGDFYKQIKDLVGDYQKNNAISKKKLTQLYKIIVYQAKKQTGDSNQDISHIAELSVHSGKDEKLLSTIHRIVTKLNESNQKGIELKEKLGELLDTTEMTEIISKIHERNTLEEKKYDYYQHIINQTREKLK